jgi:hypothetical protein
MQYELKSIFEWKELLNTEENFKKFFESDEVSNLLKYLERRLKHNIIQMISQRGLTNYVSLASRIKTFPSTYNKIRN